MTYQRLIIVLALFSLFLTDCTRGGSQVPVNQVRDYDDYEARRNNDPDFVRERDRNLRESQQRYTGSTCVKEMDKQRRPECSEQCREMYRDRDYREDCENLAIDQIDALKIVHELLEKPRLEKLRRDFDDPDRLLDLGVYLTVSIEGFDNLARGYEPAQAKAVLSWIAENDDIARMFKQSDYDDNALDELLGKLTTFSTDENIYKPLVTVSLLDRRNFVESTLSHGNGEAVDWWIGYILNRNDHCSDSTANDPKDPNDLQCFKVFCQIGKALNDYELREELLRYDLFNRYIEDVIRDKVNSTAAYSSILLSTTRWVYGTSSGEIEGVRDIDDYYVDLCKSRIPSRYAN